MHQGEQLQLPQEFALHLLEVEQDLRLGSGLLQLVPRLARQDARQSEDLHCWHGEDRAPQGSRSILQILHDNNPYTFV